MVSASATGFTSPQRIHSASRSQSQWGTSAVGSAVSCSGPAAGLRGGRRAAGLVDVVDDAPLVLGVVAGGWAVSLVGGVAGLGSVGVDVGDDVGVEVGDDVAHAATPTPAIATVRARNRSRSMRMHVV